MNVLADLRVDSTFIALDSYENIRVSPVLVHSDPSVSHRVVRRHDNVSESLVVRSELGDVRIVKLVNILLEIEAKSFPGSNLTLLDVEVGVVLDNFSSLVFYWQTHEYAFQIKREALRGCKASLLW